MSNLDANDLLNTLSESGQLSGMSLGNETIKEAYLGNSLFWKLDGGITQEQMEEYVADNAAPKNHNHTIAQVTGLQDAIDAKANVTEVPTKTSELVNDSGFITNASGTIEITNIIGTISSSGTTSVNVFYNSTIGLINLVTFCNPNRSMSGSDYFPLFLFNNEFISKVNLDLQTEIRVRDNNFNSYFTVIYLDTTGAVTSYGYKGIYMGPAQHTWTVLPGNTKYFFLAQQANIELQQYVKEHL